MNRQLKDLMYGLYYPAVLGTGLVMLILHVTKLGSLKAAICEPAIQVGILYLVFFSASFGGGMDLVEQREESGKRYNCWTFILDFLEVGLMFSGFYVLGLLEPEPKTHPEWSIGIAYGFLMFVILLQCPWRKLAGLLTEGTTAWVLRLVVLLLLLGGAIFWSKSGLVNPAVVFVAIILIGVYVKWFRKEEKK